jgi:hypothetical protein
MEALLLQKGHVTASHVIEGLVIVFMQHCFSECIWDKTGGKNAF